MAYIGTTLHLTGKHQRVEVGHIHIWERQDTQCTYNLTLRRIHETIVDVEEQ